MIKQKTVLTIKTHTLKIFEQDNGVSYDGFELDHGDLGDIIRNKLNESSDIKLRGVKITVEFEEIKYD